MLTKKDTLFVFMEMSDAVERGKESEVAGSPRAGMPWFGNGKLSHTNDSLHFISQAKLGGPANGYIK